MLDNQLRALKEALATLLQTDSKSYGEIYFLLYQLDLISLRQLVVTRKNIEGIPEATLSLIQRDNNTYRRVITDCLACFEFKPPILVGVELPAIDSLLAGMHEFRDRWNAIIRNLFEIIETKTYIEDPEIISRSETALCSFLLAPLCGLPLQKHSLLHVLLKVIDTTVFANTVHFNLVGSQVLLQHLISMLSFSHEQASLREALIRHQQHADLDIRGITISRLEGEYFTSLCRLLGQIGDALAPGKYKIDKQPTYLSLTLRAETSAGRLDFSIASTKPTPVSTLASEIPLHGELIGRSSFSGKNTFFHFKSGKYFSHYLDALHRSLFSTHGRNATIAPHANSNTDILVEAVEFPPVNESLFFQPETVRAISFVLKFVVQYFQFGYFLNDHQKNQFLCFFSNPAATKLIFGNYFSKYAENDSFYHAYFHFFVKAYFPPDLQDSIYNLWREVVISRRPAAETVSHVGANAAAEPTPVEANAAAQATTPVKTTTGAAPKKRKKRNQKKQQWPTVEYAGGNPKLSLRADEQAGDQPSDTTADAAGQETEAAAQPARVETETAAQPARVETETAAQPARVQIEAVAAQKSHKHEKVKVTMAPKPSTALITTLYAWSSATYSFTVAQARSGFTLLSTLWVISDHAANAPRKISPAGTAVIKYKLRLQSGATSCPKPAPKPPRAPAPPAASKDTSAPTALEIARAAYRTAVARRDTNTPIVTRTENLLLILGSGALAIFLTYFAYDVGRKFRRLQVENALEQRNETADWQSELYRVGVFMVTSLPILVGTSIAMVVVLDYISRRFNHTVGQLTTDLLNNLRDPPKDQPPLTTKPVGKKMR